MTRTFAMTGARHTSVVKNLFPIKDLSASAMKRVTKT